MNPPDYTAPWTEQEKWIPTVEAISQSRRRESNSGSPARFEGLRGGRRWASCLGQPGKPCEALIHGSLV